MLPARSHPQYRAHELGMKLVSLLCVIQSCMETAIKMQILILQRWTSVSQSILQVDFLICSEMCFSRKAFCNYSAMFYFLFMSKAHGFEILCSKSGQSSSEKEPSVSSNPLWRGFLDSLKTNGYFKVGKSLCSQYSNEADYAKIPLPERNGLITNKHLFCFVCVWMCFCLCACVFL